MSWNTGLAFGFAIFMTCLSFTLSGYICLIFCLAEMAGALPFAGGSFGFARVTLGPLPGFLVGICEIIQNVLTVSSILLPLGQSVTLIFNSNPQNEPIYWLIFIVFALVFHVTGVRSFWRFNMLIGSLSLVIIALYLAVSARYMNLTRELRTDSTTVACDGNSIVCALQCLPPVTWMFSGIELVTLASVYTDKVRYTAEYMYIPYIVECSLIPYTSWAEYNTVMIPILCHSLKQ